MNDLQPTSTASAHSGPATPNVHAVPAERGLQWLVSGWRLFLREPGVWLGIAVVMLVAIGLIGIVPLFGQFAIAFLLPVVAAGLLAGCRSLEQGETLCFGDLFGGFKHNTGNLVVIGVLSLLGHAAIGLVVFAVGGGAMLSGIMSGATLDPGPGMLVALSGMLFALLLGTLLMLPLAMALWFAPALVMFDDMAPVAALKSSFIGCLKNTLPFLIYGILGLVLLLLALLPALLGLLVLIPVLVGSVYASYVDIYGATPNSAPGS
ncbi:MAG: BPSS1780 family membrane protein [Sterolibacterium sp.]|nr:BPSS1780 family membrane protein [Sterolibacterium sp.]